MPEEEKNEEEVEEEVEEEIGGAVDKSEEEEIEPEIPPKIEGEEKVEGEEEAEEEAEEEEAEEEEEPEPFRTFETEEELEEFKKAEVAKITEGTALNKDEAERIFDENFQPKDAEEFAQKLLDNPKVVERLQKSLVPKTQEAIAASKAKEQAEAEVIDKGFNDQYDALAKKGKVPARNTKEGKKIRQEIINVGSHFEQSSITKAHELWSRIPASDGGGLEYTPPAKEKLNQQKRQAGKVKGSKGGKTGASKKELTHQDIHGTSMDDLLADDLEEGK